MLDQADQLRKLTGSGRSKVLTLLNHDKDLQMLCKQAFSIVNRYLGKIPFFCCPTTEQAETTKVRVSLPKQSISV